MFSGAFFVLAYSVVTWGDAKKYINSGNVFTVALPVALVSGIIVYGLHRSLVFPWVEWAFNSDNAKKLRKVKYCSLISQNVINNLVNKCDNKCKDNKSKLRGRAKYMELWADYIHLQYTSGWCIIAGSITGAIISDGNFLNHPINKWLALAAAIFFLAALSSDWRSHSVEEKWKIPEKDPIRTP